MKIISCIGYHDTGSGVVDAILKEFDNCTSANLDLECRFFQDPGGIIDLEYHLIENPHRLNSGYALKEYQRFVKKWNWFYKKIFGYEWKRLSDQYISNLISVTYPGYWHAELFLHNQLVQKLFFLRKLINKLLPHGLKKTSDFNYFPNDMMWHVCVTEEEFLLKTREYCAKLCACINKDKKEFLVLDQLLPSSHFTRYMKYFEGLKVVIVDRDPRDVYVHQMLAGAHVLPKDPIQFCKVFRDNRQIKGDDISGDILYLRFEDFIYRFDTTYQTLIDFIGEEKAHHINKGKVFDITKSRENTMIWKRYPEFDEAIAIIERELREYLYW